MRHIYFAEENKEQRTKKSEGNHFLVSKFSCHKVWMSHSHHYKIFICGKC